MDLAGGQHLTCFPQTISRVPSNTDHSRHNRLPIILSYDGPTRVGCVDRLVRLGPATGPAAQRQNAHSDLSRSSLDSGT